MNFLKELEKKSHVDDDVDKYPQRVTREVFLKDVEELYLESQRVFWNKRKREIEKQLVIQLKVSL